MNRFLLTLLALLTGLAAQVSPAQAAVREVGEAEVGSVHAGRSAVRLARQVAVIAAISGFADEAGRNEAASLPRFRIALTAVRVGIDRARE